MKAAIIAVLTTVVAWALIYYSLNYGWMQHLAYWRDV